ncbi:MAG: adenylate kinase family protein [Phycisphaerales bacterium JB043]
MKQKLTVALIFGGPGAGKGTQGKLLDAIQGFVHFSTGDAFRSLDEDSTLAKNVRQFSSKGELVPDEITLSVLRNGLDHESDELRYNPETDLLILDGFPRNPKQAELLKSYMDVVAIVHLRCSDPDVLVGRLKKRALEEGRADDAKEDVIRRRLEVYTQETEPVLSMYDKALIHEVEATGTPDEVLANVLEVLEPFKKA